MPTRSTTGSSSGPWSSPCASIASSCAILSAFCSPNFAWLLPWKWTRLSKSPPDRFVPITNWAQYYTSLGIWVEFLFLIPFIWNSLSSYEINSEFVILSNWRNVGKFEAEKHGQNEFFFKTFGFYWLKLGKVNFKFAFVSRIIVCKYQHFMTSSTHSLPLYFLDFKLTKYNFSN